MYTFQNLDHCSLDLFCYKNSVDKDLVKGVLNLIAGNYEDSYRALASYSENLTPGNSTAKYPFFLLNLYRLKCIIEIQKTKSIDNVRDTQSFFKIKEELDSHVNDSKTLIAYLIEDPNTYPQVESMKNNAVTKLDAANFYYATKQYDKFLTLGRELSPTDDLRMKVRIHVNTYSFHILRKFVTSIIL